MKPLTEWFFISPSRCNAFNNMPGKVFIGFIGHARGLAAYSDSSHSKACLFLSCSIEAECTLQHTQPTWLLPCQQPQFSMAKAFLPQ